MLLTSLFAIHLPQLLISLFAIHLPHAPQTRDHGQESGKKSNVFEAAA